MAEMIWEGWLTVSIVALLLTGLARNFGPPDMLVFECLQLVPWPF